MRLITKFNVSDPHYDDAVRIRIQGVKEDIYSQTIKKNTNILQNFSTRHKMNQNPVNNQCEEVCITYRGRMRFQDLSEK